MKKYILLVICLAGLTSFSQEQKDTLFFYYDMEYFIKKEYAPGSLYPKDFQTKEGGIFFSKKGDYYNLKPSEILCLKDYLHSLKIRKNRFSYLIDHFAQFKVFLVKEEKGKTKFIEIITGMEIF